MPTLKQTMEQVLALPREAGTPAAERARDLVIIHLTGLGYEVEVQRFRFHPSALLAFPVLGAGLGALALIIFPLLLSHGTPGWGAFLVWATGLLAVILLSLGVGLGWVPLRGAAREDANLIATRGGAAVRRWIVAHLDSKAQAQSMAGRLVAVWVIGLAIAGLTALAALRFSGAISLPLATAGTLLAVWAGLLAGRGRLRGSSRGARDNGSGLLAALAAGGESTDPETGLLITGAEEFGMVGARVFAQTQAERLRGAAVVNLDTIDEEGDLYLVSHDEPGEVLAREQLPLLAGLALPLRPRRLPLGILVDSLPLARAGARAITIGRLTWRTLRVIHTSRDTPEGLSLATAERVGRALAVN
ncbi:MAG: M28 family peptidase [Gemmatimonadales bacterium]